MSSASESFKIGLYREHLEEASALYDLRHALLLEPNREWRSLRDFEERLEAHLDALVIGGTLALEICAERMQEGDAGELFAGLSVCCRTNDRALFAKIWQHLDVGNPDRLRAVTEALRCELPLEWAPAFEQSLARADAVRLSLLAAAMAHRRLPIASPILSRLELDEQSAGPVLLEALGLLQSPDAVPIFRRYLESSDVSIRSSALRGLLLAGDDRALQQSYLAAQAEDWPHLAMGLGGDRQAAGILCREIVAGRGSCDTLLALGLLGDLSVVRVLVKCLSDEQLAETAALALHWITGAPLCEDVFVPDPIDESELFERELQAWRESGAVPRRADGRPYGSEIRRLTRNPVVWNDWLSAHGHEFDTNLRYRRGRPYGPRQLFDCLVAPIVPIELRQLAYEELMVRYGCREPFAADAFVTAQLSSLRRIAQWIQRKEAVFEGQDAI